MVLVLMTPLWGWPVRGTARKGSPAVPLSARGAGDRSQPRFDAESHDPADEAGPRCLDPRDGSYEDATAIRAQRTEEMDKT